MAWEGYYTYAGQEFINVERTAAYAGHAGAGWFRDCYGSANLGAMLGEQYRSPLQDPAPWSDPDIPDSYEFWGVYPLTITGIEDSTRSAEVIESILDGGRVGRVRHATRAVVFSAVLVGASECAVEYGMRWLKRLLLGAACGVSVTEACAGSDLCYLSCEPCLDWCDPNSTMLDALGCLDPYERSLRDTVFNVGPTVTAKNTMNDGGAAWTVSFTATAGTPWEFGSLIQIVEEFGVSTDPYVIDPPGQINMNGPIVSDSKCVPAEYLPVYDPSCPSLVPPPGPPTIPLGCYKPPSNWKRRQFTIPEKYIPLWAEVVPQIKVHATDNRDVKNLRLRFYADVNGDGIVETPPDAEGDVEGDACAYCGDIVVSYVPAGHVLVIDGSEESVYVEAPNSGKRRADSVVFATDGTPFTWPVFSCGFQYIVAIDTEQQSNLPSIDLALYPRTV